MKKWKIKDRISDEEFERVCADAKSMAAAAAELRLHFNSFKKRALELGCYSPNQAGIGIRKHMPKIRIEDIVIKNLHPQYQSYKLKKRLFEEGLKSQKCEVCELTHWQGKAISFELHHKDGNSGNHLLENLQILCPNCHSQTDNFRALNKRKV